MEEGFDHEQVGGQWRSGECGHSIRKAGLEDGGRLVVAEGGENGSGKMLKTFVAEGGENGFSDESRFKRQSILIFQKQGNDHGH
jgi:hypothetical protein